MWKSSIYIYTHKYISMYIFWTDPRWDQDPRKNIKYCKMGEFCMDSVWIHVGMYVAATLVNF